MITSSSFPTSFCWGQMSRQRNFMVAAVLTVKLLQLMAAEMWWLHIRAPMATTKRLWLGAPAQLGPALQPPPTAASPGPEEGALS